MKIVRYPLLQRRALSIDKSPRLLLQPIASRAAVGLSMLLCGCAKELPPVPMRAAAAIVVDPPTVTISAGTGLQLRAQVNDAQAQPIGGASIRFRSNNSDVVEVTALGLLSAPGLSGDAVISVSSGVRTARVSVHVTPGAAAALAQVRGPVAKTVVGSSMGDIQIRVQDAFNNPIADVALTWKLGDDSGMLASFDAKTAADGMASARWIAGEHAGKQTLTLHAGELRPFLVDAQVTAGSATTLTLKSDPVLKPKAYVTEGTPVKLWADAADRYGNPVEQVPVRFASGERCRLEPMTISTDRAGASGPFEWRPATLGDCVLTARIDAPAINARLPLTIVRDKKHNRR